MQLTEVRVNLCGGGGQAAGRLKAFCSLTFDDTFVVRDVKLIEGPDGLFLAMPSRKLCDHCPRCGEKNHLRARFCNHCGGRLDESRFMRQANGNGHGGHGHAGHGHGGHAHGGHGRLKLHADIAHPINASCRSLIENEVVDAYDRELLRSKQPGYVPPSLDHEDVDYDDAPPTPAGSAARPSMRLRPTGTAAATH